MEENEKDYEEKEGFSEDELRQIKELGSLNLPNARHVIHCLNIIGQVEGHYILPPQNKTTKYEGVWKKALSPSICQVGNIIGTLMRMEKPQFSY